MTVGVRHGPWRTRGQRSEAFVIAAIQYYGLPNPRGVPGRATHCPSYFFLAPERGAVKQTLESRNVTTEFLEVADGTVYVGYSSHATDTSKLFTELRVVVNTVLEHEPGSEVVGCVFHTEHPVIGLWRVDATWADRRRNGELSETALAARALHTLETVRF